MAETGKDTVIFLERDRLFIGSGGPILTLAFPASIMTDLDLKDKDGLFNLVTTFIQSNKLLPSQIFFVISEATVFSKDFPIKSPDAIPKVESDSQAFIDAIPFNSVLSKIYKTPTVYRAVGTNQDLIDTIVDAFVQKGFGLTALVPANVYPEYGAKRELTQDFEKHILDTKENAKTSSMVGEKEVEADHQLTTSAPKTTKSKLLPYLIGGFAVLLAVLIWVLTHR